MSILDKVPAIAKKILYKYGTKVLVTRSASSMVYNPATSLSSASEEQVYTYGTVENLSLSQQGNSIGATAKITVPGLDFTSGLLPGDTIECEDLDGPARKFTVAVPDNTFAKGKSAVMVLYVK